MFAFAICTIAYEIPHMQACIQLLVCYSYTQFVCFICLCV